MRFVVLHHTGWPNHEDHYDLMLQFAPGFNDDDIVLQTFTSTTALLPLIQSQATAPHKVLHRIMDHRMAYLNYEGPLTNHRGSVKRVDAGDVVYLSRIEMGVDKTRLHPGASPASTPLAIRDSISEIRFHLAGDHLTGNFMLRQLWVRTQPQRQQKMSCCMDFSNADPNTREPINAATYSFEKM